MDYEAETARLVAEVRALAEGATETIERESADGKIKVSKMPGRGIVVLDLTGNLGAKIDSPISILLGANLREMGDT